MPATILTVTIFIFGKPITLLSLLGYLAFVLSLLPLLYVIMRWLEMSIKDHVGGLKLKEMEKLKSSLQLLQPYLIAFGG